MAKGYVATNTGTYNYTNSVFSGFSIQSKDYTASLFVLVFSEVVEVFALPPKETCYFCTVITEYLMINKE